MAKKAKLDTDREEAVIDTLRRRGRRRLVGAVVLALFAVIFIPFLLEATPEPEPTDLRVTVEPATPEPVPMPPAEPPVAVVPPPAVVSPPPAAPVQESGPVEVKPPQTQQPPSAPPKTKSAGTPKTSDLPPTVPAANGRFAVQVGSYSDDKGANAMVRRLVRAGYPAFTEPDLDAKKTVWRVRVGAYASRKEAEQVLARLKKEKRSGSGFVVELRR